MTARCWRSRLCAGLERSSNLISLDQKKLTGGGGSGSQPGLPARSGQRPGSWLLRRGAARPAKWDQSRICSASIELPDLMDTHRVYATVLESVGLYGDSISQYKLASKSH
jgi:hypothetical protein